MNDASSEGLAAVEGELTSEGGWGCKVTAQPPAPPQALPEYVQHSDEATRSGMLSAHVIVLEFEAAAKEIEKLGEELREAQARSEEAQNVLAQALKDLTTTAKAYRVEAARVFTHVEHVTARASEASALCAQLNSKVASAPVGS